MKRFLCLLIGLLILFSVSLTACGKGSENNSTVIPEPTYTDYIYKDGTSEYTVVYPENATGMEGMGATEFIELFERATGYTLPVVKDSEVSYNADSRFIAIGNVSFLSAAGVTVDKSALGSGGYKIVNAGKSLFLIGGLYGSLYAVYDFMEQMFHFDTFAIGEDYIDENVTTVGLKDFNNYVLIPQITNVVNNYGENATDTKFMRRMRYIGEHEVVGGHGSIWHNFEIAIPKETYPQYYPYGRLCMTVDMEGLSDLIAGQVRELLLGNSVCVFLCYSQIDANVWCNGGDSCHCDELREQYGTDSAGYIRLFNMAAEKVDAMMNDPNDLNMADREFYITLMAYNSTVSAPVKTNANGEYEPVDETVKGHKRMAVIYAPYYTTNWTDSFSDPTNASMRRTLEQWNAVVPVTMCWSYGNYFTAEQHAPFYRIANLQENIQVLNSVNCKWWFNQCRTDLQGFPDWSRLYIYLTSKLNVDINADVNELTEKFFKHYFKDAADIMYELFNDEQSWLRIMINKYSDELSGKLEQNLLTDKYWSYGIVNHWLDLIEQAKESIKKYELYDHDLYEKLYDRIVLESISIRLVMVRAFRSKFPSTAEYTKFFNEYNADCARFKIKGLA